MRKAETHLLKLCQGNFYEEELKDFPQNSLKKCSSLKNLNCYVSKDTGLIRVGGRFQNMALLDLERHPVVLPACQMARAVIRYCHEKIHHQGRIFTIAKVRQEGFWVMEIDNRSER